MMSTLSNFNLIIISILILSIFGQKQQDDDLCSSIYSILCVKDVLLEISSASKKINDIAHKIEQDIFKSEPTSDTLNNHINHQMNYKQSDLPKSKYHYQFMRINNINKTDFIHLIKEENDAFTYLYNSIKTIQKISRISDNSIDENFKKILNILRKDILCNYRNILYVYSETWLSIDKIKGIHMLTTQKRQAPSFLYNSYSIIITQLLHEWMKHVNNVVVNIKYKLLQ